MGVKVGFEAALGNRRYGSQVYRFRLSEGRGGGTDGTSTDRPTTLSVKEMTTPSVKNNSFTLSVVGQYALTETFCESLSTPS